MMFKRLKRHHVKGLWNVTGKRRMCKDMEIVLHIEFNCYVK